MENINNSITGYGNLYDNSSCNLTEIGQISNFPNNINVETVESDIMFDYNYPYEDLPKLKELLEKWGLQCVYQTCVDQLIDITILATMKSEHVEKLFSKFPWGIIFKFEYELAKWQSNNTSIVNKNCKASITNASEVLCSSNKNIHTNYIAKF